MASDNENNEKGIGAGEIVGGAVVGTASAYGAAAAYGATKLSDEALEKIALPLLDKGIAANKTILEEFQKTHPQPVFDGFEFARQNSHITDQKEIIKAAGKAQEELYKPWTQQFEEFSKNHPLAKALESETKALENIGE